MPVQAQTTSEFGYQIHPEKLLENTEATLQIFVTSNEMMVPIQIKDLKTVSSDNAIIQILSIEDEFLEKLPIERLALSYSLQNMCDGEFSLAEISENVGFPFKEVKEMLDLLGKFVFYKKKYVK